MKALRVILMATAILALALLVALEARELLETTSKPKPAPHHSHGGDGWHRPAGGDGWRR